MLDIFVDIVNSSAGGGREREGDAERETQRGRAGGTEVVCRCFPNSTGDHSRRDTRSASTATTRITRTTCLRLRLRLRLSGLPWGGRRRVRCVFMRSSRTPWQRRRSGGAGRNGTRRRQLGLGRRFYADRTQHDGDRKREVGDAATERARVLARTPGQEGGA